MIGPRRRLHKTEIYSSLYYKDRILPTVRAKVRGMGGSEGPLLPIIKKITAELFAEETAEIKAIVEAAFEDAKVTDVDYKDIVRNQNPTPQEYQEYVIPSLALSSILIVEFSAIDKLPAFAQQTLNTIHQKTGLSGFFVVGGPMPQAGGSLSIER